MFASHHVDCRGGTPWPPPWSIPAPYISIFPFLHEGWPRSATPTIQVEDILILTEQIMPVLVIEYSVCGYETADSMAVSQTCLIDSMTGALS
jgi:hypothetical protein